MATSWIHQFTGFVLIAAFNLPSVIGSFGSQGQVTVIDLETNDTLAIFPNEHAGFGPQFPENGLEGRIVYAEPSFACGPLKNPAPKVTDKYVWILLISRGGDCQFADKIINAQKANYSAALVHNNFSSTECNSDLTIMGGYNGSFVTIPSAFVGCRDGLTLKDKYSYAQGRNYIVRVTGSQDIDYKMYLWPFAIVVAACFILVMVFLIIKFVRDHARQRMNRLSNRHLKKIPVRKFKKGDYYDTCAICLDEYEEGEKIRVLPCDHVYHTKCIDPWLTKSKKTCPVCKRRVIPGRDADSDDSDSDSDGGGARGTSENTPLLGSSRSGLGNFRRSSQYSGDQGASTSTVTAAAVTTAPPTGATALATGPTDEVVEEVERLLEDAERRSAQRQERRRRRRERRERQAQGATDSAEPSERRETEDQDPAAEPAAVTAHKPGKRSEHKRPKKDNKRKRRAEQAVEEETRAKEERALLEPDDDEEGFVSAQSSFREDPGPPANSRRRSGEEDPLLGAVGGVEVDLEAAKSREDYVNPSYSESQEVVMSKGNPKKEMNEVV